MKKSRQRISLQRQRAYTGPLASLHPLTFRSDSADLDVHTIHVFEQSEDATVAMVFETGAGSITVRLPRTLADKLGDGLCKLVNPETSCGGRRMNRV